MMPAMAMMLRSFFISLLLSAHLVPDP